mmetsp:Transcript_71471/g.225733  ORF Transcript_71471/g.225733 Transcript_71471/m.225733 type:complete len:227 (-) Transcript_71471:1221-1901(-)
MRPGWRRWNGRTRWSVSRGSATNSRSSRPWSSTFADWWPRCPPSAAASFSTPQGTRSAAPPWQPWAPPSRGCCSTTTGAGTSTRPAPPRPTASGKSSHPEWAGAYSRPKSNPTATRTTRDWRGRLFAREGPFIARGPLGRMQKVRRSKCRCRWTSLAGSANPAPTASFARVLPRRSLARRPRASCTSMHQRGTSAIETSTWRRASPGAGGRRCVQLTTSSGSARSS